MIEFATILDLLPGAGDLIPLLQQQPDWVDSDPFMEVHEPAPIGIGTVVAMMFFGLALSCLFGWWGKSRAEDAGVNPWIGFAAGFFFGFIGVAMVPVFRTDRVLVTRNPHPVQMPGQPNPMYAPPPQAHGQPNPMYAPPPQTHGQPMQQGYAPPPPPPEQQMLVADEYGYVECPHCATRTKAGRKSCMSCGNFLPPVFDPNIK
ncbi:MAG: hypothetical protein K8I27_05365 [Planctomycetes bacterium]|nr:hypothetical protein [Planctomycetota bacterium]